MTTDTLEQAIAARAAAWSIFIARDVEQFLSHFTPSNDGSSGVSGAYTRYTKAVAALRALCPHLRFEDRGYGAPVCCLCGESQ